MIYLEKSTYVSAHLNEFTLDIVNQTTTMQIKMYKIAPKKSHLCFLFTTFPQRNYYSEFYHHELDLLVAVLYRKRILKHVIFCIYLL